MCCPKCYNDHLLIRRRNGFERVMIYMTSKRKYVCMSCAHALAPPIGAASSARTGRGNSQPRA